MMGVTTMPLGDMIDLLNGDLSNEYKHWHFYLHAAMLVRGLQRDHLRSFLLSEAKSEMAHIQEFGDLIVGLGGNPTTKVNGFANDLAHPTAILQYALQMEEEVVANYVRRKDQARTLGGVHGSRIEVFLDNQIQHSATDADNIRRMILAGN